VDSYLEIAEQVLRRVRRPLSAHQILLAAYEHSVAPPHLRGRTQHKTLGARLSEDILKYREASRFYRTAPGRFLIRELQDDPAIPQDLRRPIVARRRRRELAQRRSLAFDKAALPKPGDRLGELDNAAIFSLISSGCYHYASSAKTRNPHDVVVWSFVLVVRDGHVLSYRQGHYREHRDTFMHRRTIGFYTPVTDADLGLFEQDDHGIVSSGIKALAIDLDVRDHQVWPMMSEMSKFQTFLYPKEGCENDLLAVISFSCPEWFDPISKRLAINDLEWLDLRSPLNHWDDYDPWSQSILHHARDIALRSL
jgi:hypothetical protein